MQLLLVSFLVITGLAAVLNLWMARKADEIAKMEAGDRSD